MRIRTAKDAFATMQRNKLRSFPGRVKGKERLRPFAKPEILPGATLPPIPVCYTMGTCLARSFDKSLKIAGLPLLSAQHGLKQPISAFNPPTTFHKINLPSIENELRWAADPSYDAGAFSLAELKGEWVDMQINAQFAHPHDKAVMLRNAFNRSFANAFDADLIFVTIGMAECWFDTQTQLYINGFPARQLETIQPGRFELHEWQTEDVKACLGRIHELIQQNTRRETPPRLVICVSPIGIGFGHGGEDQLIADVGNKAVMRVAASEFARDHEHADYGPIYEFAVLSDRATVYETGLIDHLNIACVDRFLGEYLSKHGVDQKISQKIMARGTANTYMIIRDFASAARTLDEYSETHGLDADLTSLHARALQSAGRKDEALAAYIRHATIGGKGAAKAAAVGFNLALSSGRYDLAEELIAIGRQSEDEDFDKHLPNWTDKLAKARQTVTDKETVQKRVAELLERLMTEPVAVVNELEAEYDNPATPERIIWVYAQGLIKIGDPRTPAVLRDMIMTSRAFGKQAGNKLINLVRKAGGSIDGLTEADVRKLIVQASMTENGGR